MEESHKKTTSRLAELRDAVDMVLKRTEKLDYLEFETTTEHDQQQSSQNAPSLLSDEKLTQSYGVTDMWA
jgi:hypothetical protein